MKIQSKRNNAAPTPPSRSNPYNINISTKQENKGRSCQSQQQLLHKANLDIYNHIRKRYALQDLIDNTNLDFMYITVLAV